MPTCCVCLQPFEGEDAPILMMSASGNPLVLCPRCAALVDAIAGTPDSPEREAAVRELADVSHASPRVESVLLRLVRHEDEPLSEEDAFENEEEVLEEDVPTDVAPASTGSNLYLYLGIGCLAAALVLFLLLRFVL